MDDLKNALKYIPKYFFVLSKADEQGIAHRIPMTLWPSQQYYIEHRTNRDICLKNRQTGFSTGVLADNSQKFFTQHYERQVIITHDDETSGFLLSTVRRFHHGLPPDKRPELGYDAGHRISLKKMDCYMYIDSAKSDSIGIGHGLTRAHLSEVAKWPPRKEDQLFADISQTVPVGGFITIESTPKGRGGLFHRLYMAAKKNEIPYKAFFFPWWWDVTCIRSAKDILKFTDEEKQLIEYVRSKDGVELTPEQIAFRRDKQAELKHGDLFYQEYPENDIDCWLSSDISVFDGVAIRRYMQQIQEGIHEGPITIWKDVIGGERYVIGVDPAGGHAKGDYSVATVLRVRTNEYVARIRGRIAPDLFAQEVIRLGVRYNYAELAVERIMHGHTVLRVLLEANYPNLYHHEDYDAFSGHVTQSPGWNTSGKTKPIMIDTMGSALRAGDIILWSENFLLEASGYMWEGQKTRKPSGGFDDELDALMIALQVREQAPILDATRMEVTSYASL